jgi:hypothetical protein
MDGVPLGGVFGNSVCDAGHYFVRARRLRSSEAAATTRRLDLRHAPVWQIAAAFRPG